MKIGEMLERDYSVAEKGVTPPPAEITTDDLYKMIEARERDIVSLHAEIDKLNKVKVYQDAADEIKAFHTAFMNSGFSDDQAFILVEKMLENAIEANARLFITR